MSLRPSVMGEEVSKTGASSVSFSKHTKIKNWSSHVEYGREREEAIKTPWEKRVFIRQEWFGIG